MTHLWRFFVPLLVVTGIWLIPAPLGMDPRGWSLLAIFTATILALICRPLPLGAVQLGFACSAQRCKECAQDTRGIGRGQRRGRPLATRGAFGSAPCSEVWPKWSLQQ